MLRSALLQAPSELTASPHTLPTSEWKDTRQEGARRPLHTVNNGPQANITGQSALSPLTPASKKETESPSNDAINFNKGAHNVSPYGNTAAPFPQSPHEVPYETQQRSCSSVLINFITLRWLSNTRHDRAGQGYRQSPCSRILTSAAGVNPSLESRRRPVTNSAWAGQLFRVNTAEQVEPISRCTSKGSLPPVPLNTYMYQWCPSAPGRPPHHRGPPSLRAR